MRTSRFAVLLSHFGAALRGLSVGGQPAYADLILFADFSGREIPAVQNADQGRSGARLASEEWGNFTKRSRLRWLPVLDPWSDNSEFVFENLRAVRGAPF